MADKSDPRLPSAVRHYVPPLVNPNDLPPDYSSLAAMVFGILGVMMKVSMKTFSFDDVGILVRILGYCFEGVGGALSECGHFLDFIFVCSDVQRVAACS